MKASILTALIVILGVHTRAADEKTLEDMSLDELLNVQVTVATKSAAPAREAPGIVTVITREEIRAAGARDLTDILRLVPGFDFGTDG